MSQPQFCRVGWLSLIVGLMVLAGANQGRAEEHRLGGYVNGFYSRNYGTYGILGPDAAMLGTGVNANLDGPLLDRRLLRYSIGGRYTRGWSLGLADRVRLLDQGVIMGLYFLPENWYTLGVYAEAGRFQLIDGPLHTMKADSRGYGADLNIRPRRNVPTLYNRYGDQRIETDYLGTTRGLRLRSYSARSTYQMGKSTNLDAAYDWSLADHFEDDSSFRNQRAYIQSFSRFSTDTTLSLLGSGNWVEADAVGAGQAKSRSMALRSYFYQRVDDRNYYTLTHGSDTFQAAGYESTFNNLQALWNHHYTTFLLLNAGGEFAQAVTSGGVDKLTYEKYREAGIAGFYLRLGDANVEITPSYQARLGVTQVPGFRGGTFYGHSAALPVAIHMLEGLPLSVAGFYSVEGDNSEIPAFQRYRSVNFRADTYSARSESGTFLTHIYLDAQRSRHDGKVLQTRNRRDESRVGVQANNTIRPFYSQFGTGYAFSRVETLDAEFDIHHLSGSWGYTPMQSLSFLNQLDWSRIVYPSGDQVSRTGFRSEVIYFARSLEFLGAYRYDDYGGPEGSSWGLLFEVRRHFAVGI